MTARVRFRVRGSFGGGGIMSHKLVTECHGIGVSFYVYHSTVVRHSLCQHLLVVFTAVLSSARTLPTSPVQSRDSLCQHLLWFTVGSKPLQRSDLPYYMRLRVRVMVRVWLECTLRRIPILTLIVTITLTLTLAILASSPGTVVAFPKKLPVWPLPKGG